MFHSQNNKTIEVKQTHIPVKEGWKPKVLQMVHSVDSSQFNFFPKKKITICVEGQKVNILGTINY